MRVLQSIRWWMFIPFLLVLIVPGWMKLGDYLGYDLLVSPDPSPPRFNNHLLGACYYLVWWVLFFIAVIPSLVFKSNLGGLVPDSFSSMVGLVFVAFLYSVILFLL